MRTIHICIADLAGCFTPGRRGLRRWRGNGTGVHRAGWTHGRCGPVDADPTGRDFFSHACANVHTYLLDKREGDTERGFWFRHSTHGHTDIDTLSSTDVDAPTDCHRYACPTTLTDGDSDANPEPDPDPDGDGDHDHDTYPVPTATHTPTPAPAIGPNVVIACIFYDGIVTRVESDEYVQITNLGDAAQSLAGWTLRDISDLTPIFQFPSHLLAPGDVIRVYTNEVHSQWGGFSFGRGTAVWSNDDPDWAGLFDAAGNPVSSRSYPPGCE